jgi:hypothetical protein
MAHRPDAAAPLLAKPDADATPPPPPKRNKYPFFCAVLASMTSVLMGYSMFSLSTSTRLANSATMLTLCADARRQTWR